ncbi:MAG: hypothetical protein IKD70_02220 [Eggerthellaceae bacterium]|nr:hypothetical protein [Eggerthellaceae bacterium]
MADKDFRVNIGSKGQFALGVAIISAAAAAAVAAAAAIGSIAGKLYGVILDAKGGKK